MSTLVVISLLVISFLAGVEGILDEWGFHQPLVACTLIGIATGHIAAGVLLGGSLQLIALGWMNIGAAVSPDAALASVVSAFLVCGPAHVSNAMGIAIAVPVAVCGQAFTRIVRILVVRLVHIADHQVARGNIASVSWLHLTSLVLQGLRVAVPMGVVMLIPTHLIQAGLTAIPKVITNGLTVAAGFIVVVGYAMLINMMASKALWPFFFLGFALAAVQSLNMVALGLIGVCLAFIYIQLTTQHHDSGHGGGTTSPDPLDDELDDLDQELEDL